MPSSGAGATYLIWRQHRYRRLSRNPAERRRATEYGLRPNAEPHQSRTAGLPSRHANHGWLIAEWAAPSSSGGPTASSAHQPVISAASDHGVTFHGAPRGRWPNKTTALDARRRHVPHHAISTRPPRAAYCHTAITAHHPSRPTNSTGAILGQTHHLGNDSTTVRQRRSIERAITKFHYRQVCSRRQQQQCRTCLQESWAVRRMSLNVEKIKPSHQLVGCPSPWAWGVRPHSRTVLTPCAAATNDSRDLGRAGQHFGGEQGGALQAGERDSPVPIATAWGPGLKEPRVGQRARTS